MACNMILVAISKRFWQILMDFGRIQMVFWKGFGGITNDCKRFRLQNLLEGQMEAKIYLWGVLRDAFTERVVESIFW